MVADITVSPAFVEVLEAGEQVTELGAPPANIDGSRMAEAPHASNHEVAVDAPSCVLCIGTATKAR